MKRLLLVLLFLGLVFSCEEGDQEPPAQIKDLTFFTDPSALSFNNQRFTLGAEQFPARTIALAWTATGDNGEEGEASLYDLRYISETERAENKIPLSSLCDQSSAYLHKVYGEPFPKRSGEPEIFNLIDLGLEREETYYFCLWAIDEIGQASSPAWTSGKISFLGIELSSGTTINQLGEFARGIGDFNQDGRTDLALTSPSQGKVLIYWGKEEIYKNTLLFGNTLKQTRSFSSELEITGSGAERFGERAASLEDFDRDGIKELAITSPFAGSGRIYLFKSSSASSLSTSDAWVVINGEQAGDSLGREIAFCSDLNQDGFYDFAVSAPGAGKVYLVLGGDSTSPLGALPSSASISQVASVVIQGSSAEGFGSALACGSDLNGDGAPDLLVSAPLASSGGEVYLFLGGNAGVIDFTGISSRALGVQWDLAQGDSADLVISSAQAGEKFGFDLVMLEDVWARSLADLSRDFAVSAPGIAPGKIYLFWGGTKGNLALDQLSPPGSADTSFSDLILTGNTSETITGKMSAGVDFNQDFYYDLAFSTSFGVKLCYLNPTSSSSEIKCSQIYPQEAISSFSLIKNFSGKNHSYLLLGIAGRNRGYLLK